MSLPTRFSLVNFRQPVLVCTNPVSLLGEMRLHNAAFESIGFGTHNGRCRDGWCWSIRHQEARVADSLSRAVISGTLGL